MPTLEHALFYQFFEKAQDAIFILKDDVTIECNQAAVNLFGYKHKEDALHTAPSERGAEIQEDGKSSQALAATYLKTCHEEGECRFEWLAKKRDNTLFWIEVTLTKLEIDGEIYILDAIRDINQRKKLEQDLAFQNNKNHRYMVENEQYRKAIENYLIVSKTDLSGTITYVNQAFCDISGYRTEELIGQKHSIVKNGKMPESTYKTLWKTIQAGDVWKGEIINRNKKGEDYYVKSIIIPLFDSDHNVVEYMSIREDITALVRSKDAAIEQENEKDLLLSKVSHELRTPLHGIMGFVKLLKKEPDLTERSSYLDTIYKESESLLSLINELLDHAKLKSQEFTLNPKPTNVYLFLADEIDFFKPMMIEKNINFKKIIAPDLPEFIELDTQRIRQVLHNLIANAVKFTPINGHINFSVVRREEKIVIKIRDDGIGIDNSYKEKIFNAFAQVSQDNTVSKTNGTGLGLAIASTILKKMQSQLKVKSTLGQGSSFYFSIPIKECTTEKTLQEKLSHIPLVLEPSEDNINLYLFLQALHFDMKKTPEKTLPTLSIGHKASDCFTISLNGSQRLYIDSIFDLSHLYKQLYYLTDRTLIEPEAALDFHLNILVVEDYETNRLYLKNILEQIGIHVTLAENGRKALSLLNDNRYDLILSDINMPVLDGFELSRMMQLRHIETPIYALTADTTIKTQNAYKNAYFKGVLFKPFDLTHIVTLLKELKFDSYINIKKASKLKKNDAVATKIGIDNITLKNLYQTYLNNLKKDLPRIESSLKEEDNNSVKKIIHKIKGSSGSLMRDTVHHACLSIEEALEQKDHLLIHHNMTKIKTDIDLVESLIDAL